ncbi:class I SAM-dependent methyltransferase [Chitinophaga lutea]|nr:class I SAM-dependent methyltransferase [Chitinophaga lutea]
MNNKQFIWHAGELPFYWGPLTAPHNGFGLPDSLPFSISVEVESGRLYQLYNAQTEIALTEAYKLGSQISGMMEDEGIGKRYADDFLAYICQILDNKEKLQGAKILEIGCGSGYLLSRLQHEGANVLGIEPGVHCQEGAFKYNVPIIHDFFPSEKVTEQFDIIIAYNVLEHILDPLNFLEKIKLALAPGGRLIIGVPDCEPFIKAGDISIFIHEHWSYFTTHTLINTLKRAGADNVITGLAKFGGDVYACCTFSNQSAEVDHLCIEQSIQAAEGFKYKAEEGINILKKLLKERLNQSIGIFVAPRIMNILPQIMLSQPIDNLRFFDDNPKYENKYFPCLNIPIESRKNLIHKPLDTLLIMSRTFGEKIKRELEASLSGQTKIITWSEIYSSKNVK